MGLIHKAKGSSDLFDNRFMFGGRRLQFRHGGYCTSPMSGLKPPNYQTSSRQPNIVSTVFSKRSLFSHQRRLLPATCSATLSFAPSALNVSVQPQNAKKSLKAPFCHKTMWACGTAPHFPRFKTPYSASFSVSEGAGCWPWRSTLAGLAAPNPQKLSTAQQSYPQKIYENIAFP